MVNLPRRLDDQREWECWMEEIRSLKRLVEDLTGRRVTDADLEREIVRRNQVIGLFQEILALRRTDPVPIKSSKLQRIDCLQYALNDDEEFISGLRDLVDDLKQRKANGLGVYEPEAPRLLVTGSCTCNHGEPPISVTGSCCSKNTILELVESAGGAPVVEDFCTALRSYWTQVPYGRDPLAQIARHYAYSISCGGQIPIQKRLDMNVAAALQANVDGVLYINIRKCNFFYAEIKKFQKAFESIGIPLAFVERTADPSTELYEQINTRLEPFIEMLKQNKKGKVVNQW
jgi:benzoyl-CoA reductase/2-hydroxyglutaryl-CoA dehydratase subunit BcrC/BadD/HgdB